MICLDDFTPPTADERRIKESVERTIAWAKRAKAEFMRQLELHQMDNGNRPLLLAPIQGHNHPQLRQQCSQALQEIGFDIYGLGGWPLDEQGKFDYSFCRKNAELTPRDSLRFALGVGTPENMVKLFFMGYQFFDCVLPTRDARHGRLYVFKTDPAQLTRAMLEKLAANDQLDEVFGFLYLNKGQLATEKKPVSNYCDCPICTSSGDKSNNTPQVSRAYLHHLFKIGDSSAHRLASLHNLRTYARVMELLRQEE
jgi:queuine tRNA-ribosyltransferase